MRNVQVRTGSLNSLVVVISGTLLLGIYHSAFAQAPIQLRGGVTLTSTRYDNKIADSFNLSTRGWGFRGVFAPRFFGFTSLLAEGGWEYWAQVCIDPSDCEPDRGSTSSIMGSLGAGLVSPLLFVDDPEGRWGFGLTLYAGREWISAGLSQDGCLNCTIPDLDVNGGYWIEGGLDVTPDPSIVVGFVYRRFESSADVSSHVGIRVIGRWY